MNRRQQRLRRVRRVERGAAAVLLALALGGVLGAAPSDEDAEYPHGDFRDDCALCHESSSWSPAVIDEGFDHAAFGFPLEGAHRDAPCLLCHLTLEFRETTGAACVDCHTDPHIGELGPDCSRCHDVRDFRNPSAERRNHRMTRFPLRGVHATVDCDDCHTGGVAGEPRFVNTPTDCWSCHADEWRAATNPDHESADFPTDCTECHTEFEWGGAGFDHSITGFPLTGRHRQVGCAECHPGFVFEATPTDCYACHADDYAATMSPPHESAAFPTDCARCHDTSGWLGAVFDHALTAFPLTGAHVPLDCRSCHGDGVYVGLDTACISCHQSDWDGTDDPNHAAAGFSTDCTECHTTSDWDDADFNHALTAFPLTGAHVSLNCASCHSSGTYVGLDTACITCHRADWDRTTDPNHEAALFPTDCTDCHSTTTWEGADFDHDGRYFPIDTGKHRTFWDSCTDCHTNPASYGDFSCFGCHPHSDRSRTDEDHSEEGGYEYLSPECLRCHPDGES